ncbi:MAG: hypothetical protein JWP87_2813 [Labilithrix sp.]|nr:hypothetical protein [Labilithrix sp.]
MTRISTISPAALALVLAAACSKPDPPAPTAVAVPSEAPVIAITATPLASAVPVASASASAPASASASAGPHKSAVGASAAPTKQAPPAASAAPALEPASTRVAGKNFTLDVSSPGCRVDTPCTLTLRLAATGDYHVNKEYPYKFTATATPGVTFLGSGPDPHANTFSRASGDFREDGEKAATMTVRFKASAAGEARVSGTYKMSVCSAENCQIETQTVALGIPVM